MSQPNGKGKGKADSSGAPSQPTSSTSASAVRGEAAAPGPASSHANHGSAQSYNVAAELGRLLQSSGKPVASASAGLSSANFGGSALGDALGGMSSQREAAAAGPGAAFREAGAAIAPDSAYTAGAASQEEAAAFFRQGAPSSSALPSGTAVAAAAASPPFQHPMLRPGAPLSPRFAEFSEALRGPWSTASDLDGELYAHARRESLVRSLDEGSGAGSSQRTGEAWSNEFAAGLGEPSQAGREAAIEGALEEAWRAHMGPLAGSLEDASGYGAEWLAQLDEPTRRAMMNPNFHAEWASTVPAPVFGAEASSSSLGPRERSGQVGGAEMDFLATLEAEEREEETQAAQRAHITGGSTQIPAGQIPTQTDDLSILGIDPHRLPSGITSEWRPPSPSQATSVSVEQLLLHRALAAKQEAGEAEDEERARERLRPADDDERERQGLYAATPEDALRTIWDGQSEAERVKRDKQQRLADIAQKQRAGESVGRSPEEVQQLIADVKRWFPRGSYAEEVHGVPPLLAQTLADAELSAEESDPDLQERRMAAIRRLDAMRTQLQGVRGRQPQHRPQGRVLSPDTLARLLEQSKMQS